MLKIASLIAVLITASLIGNSNVDYRGIAVCDGRIYELEDVVMGKPFSITISDEKVHKQCFYKPIEK